MSEATILDGLAWASLTEQARIARIASILAQHPTSERGQAHTKTYVKEVIRNTSPPYGRGKYVFEAVWGEEATEDSPGVEGEMVRQQRIHNARKNEQDEFKRWQEHQALRSTRLNNAYAAAFDRPPYEPSRTCPIHWSWDMGRDSPEFNAKIKWEEAERDRDKGDTCLALTHQGDYVVALVETVNLKTVPHIAVRKIRGGRGPIVRTYLRPSQHDLLTFPDAIVSLGGPKVRAALTYGKKVKTDWVGRRSFIYHDGSDHHEAGKVEELPWRACVYEKCDSHYIGETHYDVIPVIVHGDEVTPDTEAEED